MKRLPLLVSMFALCTLTGSALAQPPAGDKPAPAPGAAQPAAPAKPADAKPADAKQPASKPAETAHQETPPVYVKMTTSMGDIVLELNADKAPISTANFMAYVEKGTYNGTIFHRVIPGFMVQGGGFNPDMTQKATDKPIKNEWKNGLKNQRGTIAMARTSDPDSATCQFFINVVNNDMLDKPNGGAAYAVFGKVVSGMEVVDKIVGVKTTNKGPHQNVPVDPVTIKSVEKIAAPAPAPAPAQNK